MLMVSDQGKCLVLLSGLLRRGPFVWGMRQISVPVSVSDGAGLAMGREPVMDLSIECP